MRRLATLLVVSFAAVQANATIFGFAGPLMTGLQENPPNNSTGYGSISYTLDDSTWQLTGSMTIVGIPLANITGYHIHAAPVGSNGPIIFDLQANTVGSPIVSGNAIGIFFNGTLNDQAGFTRAQKLAAMLAGNTYANVHTQQFPAGEIRGQIECVVVPEPATIAALGFGLLPLLRKRKR